MRAPATTRTSSSRRPSPTASPCRRWPWSASTSASIREPGRGVRHRWSSLAPCSPSSPSSMRSIYWRGTRLAEALVEAPSLLRARIETGLAGDERLAEIGLAVVAVRVGAIRPEPDLERALGTPARELVQQDADRATFERRALAVESERAIAENELHNQIELSKREEQLIAQRGPERAAPGGRRCCCGSRRGRSAGQMEFASSAPPTQRLKALISLRTASFSRRSCSVSRSRSWRPTCPRSRTSPSRRICWRRRLLTSPGSDDPCTPRRRGSPQDGAR